MADDTAVEWFCSTLVPDENFRTKGVADKSALWKKKVLTIGFLQGSAQLQDRVFKTARRWTDPTEGGANLQFERATDASSADIRIAFDPASGSWSYVGTDAVKSAGKGKPTMNLGWATEGAPEKTFASVVLHEFGHALGLLHEHNHPLAELKWKKDVVYADLGGPPNNWSKKTIDFNVFESYPPGRVVMSPEMDRVSIMIYTIPARWLDGQPGITPSDHLSEEDIRFIRRQYN
jgi:serralysin